MLYYFEHVLNVYQVLYSKDIVVTVISGCPVMEFEIIFIMLNVRIGSVSVWCYMGRKIMKKVHAKASVMPKAIQNRLVLYGAL